MNAGLNMALVGEASHSRAAATRVGYVEGSIGGPDRLATLATLFPHVDFVSVGPTWPDQPPAGLTALIVGAVASDAERVARRLAVRSGAPIIIALRDSDAATARRLVQAGAADILPAPVNEAALALSLHRLLSGAVAVTPPGPAGKVITILKAGGGVGATALGAQLAAMLANRTGGESGVCFADLDLQFGLGALFLDLAEAMTLPDILDGGGPLEDTPLASALAIHRSGARLLAAPRDLTPLEAVSPDQIDGLLAALRRDFAITLIDLPTVWTAWTNRVLQLSDQILMVTNLSVPHANLVNRQIRVMAAQRLDTIPLVLVCNRVSTDQKSVISVKAAEKAIGRAFDVVVPEDRGPMNEAIAQGCELSSLRGGAKLEKAIARLADVIAPQIAAPEPKRAWRFP